MSENPIPENPTLEPFITPEKEQKFCKNCANLIGVRYGHYLTGSTDWKCGAKENTGTPILNLVSGEFELNLIHPLCSDQRREQLVDNRCGPEGKWYEEYKQPQFLEPDLPIRRKSFRLSEEDFSNL